MLAKEFKTETIAIQLRVITEELDKASFSDGNGSGAIRYVGKIYCEVQRFLENQGFIVRKLQLEQLDAINGGIPTYIIEVNEDMIDDISDEEFTKMLSKENFQ